MGKKKRNKPNMPRNLEWMQAKLDQSRSSAARPHRNKKAYTRKRKHKGSGND